MSVKRLALLLTTVFFCCRGSLSAKNDCKCCPDASMTISYKLGLHFLFRGDMMYKIRVNVSEKTLEFVDSFSINQYFTLWRRPKVTRCWAWSSDIHKTNDYHAVIGDHEFNSYIRISRNNKKLKFIDIWYEDSMSFLSFAPTKDSRAFFYSIYEPGYAFFEEFGGHGMAGQHHFVVSIKPTGNIVDFSKVEWISSNLPQITNGKNPGKSILFRQMNQNLTPIGVFLTGPSRNSRSNQSQPVVVFLAHNNALHHCFGDVSTDNCQKLENYRPTPLDLFGCNSTIKANETTTTTTISDGSITTTSDRSTNTTTPKKTEKKDDKFGNLVFWILIAVVSLFVILCIGGACVYFMFFNQTVMNNQFGGEYEPLLSGKDKRETRLESFRQSERKKASKKELFETDCLSDIDLPSVKSVNVRSVSGSGSLVLFPKVVNEKPRESSHTAPTVLDRLKDLSRQRPRSND